MDLKVSHQTAEAWNFPEKINVLGLDANFYPFIGRFSNSVSHYRSRNMEMGNLYLFIFFAVFFRQKCNNIQMTMQPFYGFEMGNNLLTLLSGLVHVQPMDNV